MRLKKNRSTAVWHTSPDVASGAPRQSVHTSSLKRPLTHRRLLPDYSLNERGIAARVISYDSMN